MYICNIKSVDGFDKRLETRKRVLFDFAGKNYGVKLIIKTTSYFKEMKYTRDQVNGLISDYDKMYTVIVTFCDPEKLEFIDNLVIDFQKSEIESDYALIISELERCMELCAESVKKWVSIVFARYSKLLHWPVSNERYELYEYIPYNEIEQTIQEDKERGFELTTAILSYFGLLGTIYYEGFNAAEYYHGTISEDYADDDTFDNEVCYSEY